ncbi:S-adenosyl-L-methionine-dependent methyltransferase [Glomus cerebriforme]|uniref:S-adenosyl-L-methionine-dependent methyltransferase n=1 Tax=Glomus cerebriforme TaxID=658196 RepID=A0A397SH50_9GLOM|nr:S-adenosyl-L-methionine-dependent methyltransferase [Glomus cerebriforme]
MGQPHSTTASSTHNYLLTPPISPSHSPSHSPRSSSPVQKYYKVDSSHIFRDVSPVFRSIDPKTYDDILKRSKYQLPSENEHIDRIQLRHLIFRYVWQGNFSSPVEEKLKDGAKILDVGCGSGSFILDVAPQFPNSKFYGIDTAQMYPSPNDPRIPPNASFSQIDIVKGLPFDDNTFDFVHLRFLVQYLTEEQWNEKVIKELLRVTKVGGWIEIMELDLIFHNEGPNTAKLQGSTISYFNAQNINSIISPRLSQFLSSTSSFSTIHHEKRCTPLGCWGGRLGEFALIYFSMAFKNMKKVLPQFMGINGDEYDVLVERFNEECEEYRTYMKTFKYWGQKC